MTSIRVFLKADSIYQIRRGNDAPKKSRAPWITEVRSFLRDKRSDAIVLNILWQFNGTVCDNGMIKIARVRRSTEFLSSKTSERYKTKRKIFMSLPPSKDAFIDKIPLGGPSYLLQSLL